MITFEEKFDVGRFILYVADDDETGLVVRLFPKDPTRPQVWCTCPLDGEGTFTPTVTQDLDAARMAVADVAEHLAKDYAERAERAARDAILAGRFERLRQLQYDAATLAKELDGLEEPVRVDAAADVAVAVEAT